MLNKILDFIKETEIDDIKIYNDVFTQSVIVTMTKGFKSSQQIFPYEIVFNSTEAELKFYLKRYANMLKEGEKET